MNLDIIKLQTTWNDAAGSINSNYAKIADAIAQLKANGGGGGGGADIDLTDYATKVWVEAKGYITASALTPYAKTADVSTTYATIASVQGFENRIGGLEGAVPQLNERVTTVEGKVSSLNETVSTGKNNLLDRVNTIETDYVTSGNLESAINGIDLSVYLLKADLTKSRIQSTLGISDWALAATKPSYTAAEVGALSLDGTTKMQQEKNIEWSNTEGYEDIDVFSNGLRLLGYNASKGNYGGGIHIGTRYGWQLMTKYGENPLYYRSYDINSQIWRDWKQLAFITDNVASATKLQTPRKLWGQSFDGTAKIGGDITLNALQDGRQLSIQQSGAINFFAPPNNSWVTSLNIYANDKTTLLTHAFGVHGIGEDVQYAFIGGTYDHPNVVVQDDTGYVGIGTISPEARLHVIGTIKSDNLYVSNQINVKTIVGRNFGLYSSDTNPYLELNQNGKIAYLQMMGDNGMVALGSTASKSLVVNAAGFVSVNRGYVNPTEALDVGGNILASGNINATSITINGVTITASNGSITVNGNVFATGDITGGV